MNRSIKYFVLRSAAVILPVPLLLLTAYILLDPYRTLRHYDNYFADNALYVNKTMVTVETYLNNRARGMEYDSFIFGSSISVNYLADDWRRYLPAGASPFHFDGSSDRLDIIADKFEWLAERDTIAHALIILDPMWLYKSDERSIMMATYPALVHNRNWLQYHYTFVNTFCDINLLMSYIPYCLTGRKVMYSPRFDDTGTVFETQNFADYRSDINEEYSPRLHSHSLDTPEFIHRFGTSVTLVETPVQQPPQLTGKTLDYLHRIARVVRRQHTDLMVIVGPNMQARTLNPADADTLRAIFGPRNVADLSATMLPEALSADSLYFDPIHYRPALARRYMQAAYGSRYLLH